MLPADEEKLKILDQAIQSMGHDPKTADYLPIVVGDLLMETHTQSPRFNEQFTLACRAYAGDAGYDPEKIQPKQIYNCAKDICRGLLYTAKKCHPEQPGVADKLSHIRIVGKDFPGLMGVYYNKESDAYELIINNELLYSHVVRQQRSPVRDLTHDKVPGMKFNMQELTILAGVEEMSHVFEMEKAPPEARRPDYVTTNGVEQEKYQNDPLEIKAAELLKQAVKDLNLGIKSQGTDTSAFLEKCLSRTPISSQRKT